MFVANMTLMQFTQLTQFHHKTQGFGPLCKIKSLSTFLTVSLKFSQVNISITLLMLEFWRLYKHPCDLVNHMILVSGISPRPFSLGWRLSIGDYKCPPKGSGVIIARCIYYRV